LAEASRNPAAGKGTGNFLEDEKDSAEKPYECFDEAQHERKISNDFDRSSVRPEVLEG
jgi:hypothetical protein